MCQSFWDVQYSKLKFGKGCHRKLKCIVWRSHVGARLRDSNMVAGNQWKHLEFTLAVSKRLSPLFKHSNIGTSLKVLVTSLSIWVTQNLKT